MRFFGKHRAKKQDFNQTKSSSPALKEDATKYEYIRDYTKTTSFNPMGDLNIWFFNGLEPPKYRKPSSDTPSSGYRGGGFPVL